MGRPYGRVSYDLTGQKFGRYMVLRRVGHDNQNAPLWLCRCICNTQKLVRGSDLRRGNVVSCGCYNKSELVKRSTKHGFANCNDPTYRCWGNMIQRCTNPKVHNYYRYGGRGIMVCERWQTFANFLSDMGEQPRGFTIERMDNSLGYFPENCCWVPRAEQSKNRECVRKQK